MAKSRVTRRSAARAPGFMPSPEPSSRVSNRMIPPLRMKVLSAETAAASGCAASGSTGQ